MQGGFRLFVVISALALASSACSSNRPPPPFEVHSAAIVATHHLGTSLSGPVIEKKPDVSYANPLDINVTWFALERFNCNGLSLLASKATLVTARLADQAVLPSTSLTSNARIGWFLQTPAENVVYQSNPSRYFQLGQARSALPAGATASFRAFDTNSASDQTLIHAEPRFVELSIARVAAASPGGTDDLQIAMSIQDSPHSKPHSDSPPWPAGVYQHETAILDQPATNLPQSFLLIVPFHFSGPTNEAIAAYVTISGAANDAGFNDAVTRCKADLSASPLASANPSWTLGLSRALKELDVPEHRRAALVFLASEGDAHLAEDVAMLADDAMLQQIAASVKQDAPAAIKDANLEQYDWILNRSAVAVMQPLLAKNTLPSELFAVLIQHFGEPGRHSASVDEIMRGSSSTRELHDKLISENYIYLEDSSPAARVRAYNWLAAQKLAPAGFDPLAPSKQRRQALDQALSAGNVNGGNGGGQ